MHICVLGAGVIGLTSAYRLLKANHQVTLVDAATLPGSQISLGNGAQMSYSYVSPLADLSVWNALASIHIQQRFAANAVPANGFAPQ